MALWCRSKRWILHQRMIDPRDECRRLDKAARFTWLLCQQMVEPSSFIPFVAELKHPGTSLLQLFCNRLETLGWWVQLVCESCGRGFTDRVLRQSSPWGAGVEVAFHHAMATQRQSWGVWGPCTGGNRLEHQAQYLWGVEEILSRWSPLKGCRYLGKSYLKSGSFGSGCGRHCVASFLSLQALLL